MAFTSKILKVVQGTGGRVVSGSFTNTGGSTGGDIETGLSLTQSMVLSVKDSSVATSFPVVNETFPITGKTTIVTAANQNGYWIATGV